MIRHAMLATLLLAPGCKDKPSPDATAQGVAVSAPAADAAPAMARPPAPDASLGPPDAVPASDAAPPPPPPPPPRPTGKKVGVAACDDYLEKMARCITRLSPESAEPMAAAMEDTRKAWQETAATSEGRAALGDACKAALDAAQSAAKAMGCSW